MRIKTADDRTMEIAEELMDEYRELFEVVAKNLNNACKSRQSALDAGQLAEAMMAAGPVASRRRCLHMH